MNKHTVRHIYVYSTSHLSPTERVKFFYALKGRNGKPGILSTTQSKFLAKSVLQVASKNADEVEQFLKVWKCKFNVKCITTTKKNTHAFVRYSTSKLSSSELVRFVYAMYGRGGSKGILKPKSKEILAKTVLLVPLKQLTEIKQFFESWNCKLLIEEVHVDE